MYNAINFFPLFDDIKLLQSYWSQVFESKGKNLGDMLFLKLKTTPESFCIVDFNKQKAITLLNPQATKNSAKNAF